MREVDIQVPILFEFDDILLKMCDDGSIELVCLCVGLQIVGSRGLTADV